MTISKLRISNWKSFGELDPDWIYLDRLNYLIGPNSHGKTNFANAVRLLFYGKNPDYGGDQRIRAGNEILKRDFYDPDVPIVIEANLTGTEEFTRLTINSDLQLHYENQVKGIFFPIGARRELYKIDTENNWTLIQKLWPDIINDFNEYFEGTLESTPLKEQERFLSDLRDDKRQVFYESGSGLSSVLYFIIELKLNAQKGCNMFLFEEPETHMHPSLTRYFSKYLLELVNTHDFQFFLTTHSSTLINTSVSTPNSKIFHVHKQLGISHVNDITTDNKGLFNLIYHTLGNKPSDILLANTVVWVEGPSDRIFLKKWITEKAPDLQEGIDYTIMFYGGSLLSYLSIESEVDKFVKLSSLNPNSAIIMDSDIRDRSENFQDKKKNRNKLKVRQDFEKNGGFGWITAGKEIENYLDHTILEKAVVKIHKRKKYQLDSSQFGVRTFKGMKKVDVALAFVNILENDQCTTIFDILDLNERIKNLVDWVKEKAYNK